MSLLLDALKKAAEQKEKQKKAAKAKAGFESADALVPDETETELLDSEDNTEVIEVNYKNDATETELFDNQDKTEVSETNYTKVGVSADEEVGSDQTEYDSGDDDTQIMSVDSTAYDPTELEQEDATVIQDREDETVLLEKESEDNSERIKEFLNESDDEDDDDDTQIMPGAFGGVAGEAEQTEITASAIVEPQQVVEAADSEDDDEIDKTVIIETGDETVMPSFDEDETMSILSNEDVSDFLGGGRSEDETVVTAIGSDETTQRAIIEPDEMTQRAAIESDETTQQAVIDEDMSTNLVDQDGDDDTTTNNLLQTDSTNVQLLINGEVDTEGLALTDYKVPTEEQTGTVTVGNEPAVTSEIELESLRNEATILRQDPTSTNTYAPDNYDRTLIRAVNDDASKIFAGMKSEEDVLMTPDYAKRVFRSKSSANQLQYFKVYLGIAVSILLAIGIFALFELQDEYDQIDMALKPLKRDPMPGIVSNTQGQNKVNLQEEVIEPDADRITLKLIENAQITAITTEPNEAEETVSEVEEEVTESTSEVAGEPETKTEISTTVVAGQVVEPEVVAIVDTSSTQNTTTINVNQIEPKSTVGTTTKSLKITTDEKFVEKEQWLSEAYLAYQRGDDVTALQKYNQVLEVDPENRNALLARAAIAVQNRSIAAAIADYQQILLDNPKDSLAMSSLISVANISPEDSESQLKIMIRDEPESPYLNFVLANIYGAQNRWQEAQGLYFKALENNPDDPNYAYNLAVSLEHISKPKVAIAYYERAIINIDNGLATFNKDVVDRRIELLRRL